MMTMYNEAYASPWSANQPPPRWFSADCYTGINMADRHQREEFLWPPAQASTPAGSESHSPMSSAADLFKWKSSQGSHVPQEFSNISSDAMNNNNHHHHHHHVGRHESTSSNGSYRSNGAPGGLHSPGTPLTGGASSLVIPQPLKPPQQKLPNKSIQCKMCDQIFSMKSDMLIHCQQVHKQDMKTFSPSAFRCPQCQKCFANSSYLSQHNRIHAGIKPYKCEICERKFTQLSHLQQHIRTHTVKTMVRLYDLG
ncbi:zinc finger protein rotund-like [Mya arenaria]|uniref:zinc finger protein rotund-like n=1 Tax=Mya arenaria TaxID=6604 RepID=UPI0022E8E2AD|nr:zinc finger protein rotund-like [Mya arenaria]